MRQAMGGISSQSEVVSKEEAGDLRILNSKGMDLALRSALFRVAAAAPCAVSGLLGSEAMLALMPCSKMAQPACGKAVSFPHFLT